MIQLQNHSFSTLSPLRLKRTPKMKTTPETTTPAMLEHRLIRAEIKFRRSCDQIVLINHALSSLSHRYKKTKTDNRRSFRYPLRLKLAVVEGIRNMYYDYAKQKADEVKTLKDALEDRIRSEFDDGAFSENDWEEA